MSYVNIIYECENDYERRAIKTSDTSEPANHFLIERSLNWQTPDVFIGIVLEMSN